MKLQILAAVISFSLSACVVTKNDTVSSPQMSRDVIEHISAKPPMGLNNSDEITLEQIMADPDWFGRSPESWYWGDDNKTVFYQQKQEGNPLRDLYRKNIDTQGNGEAVKLAEMHVVADRGAVVNKAGTHEAYSFEGNVFIKEIATKKIKQLTYTSANEKSVMFLNDGSVAYQIDNIFYAYQLESNQVRELANLVMSDDPNFEQAESSYLAREQKELIDYIALKERNKSLHKQQALALKTRNDTVTDTTYYLGDNKKVVHAVLSPSGDKLFVSIASNKSSRSDTDIMPNYITSDGNIAAEKVRARVANNRVYSEELFILDLAQHKKSPLAYDTLPGFDQDVLAKVRQENYARDNQVYQSKSTPRNIHVMQAYTPVQWHKNGQAVAVMLEAWDNKDRWIATIDFENNKLVSQHRLHDDAWVNHTFNEFGWLNNSATLYYLSEESGYSQLYLKPITGTAKALTTGRFVVNDLTLSKDDSKIFYQANKKHPGIYEIYQVDVQSGESIALTDLGGMNEYTLSPDESKLLIEHSEITMPPELYQQDAKAGAVAQRLTHTVTDDFLRLPWSAPSIIAIPSSHQEDPIYSKVYLPKNFDQTQAKNKAVMFTHGAGYLQNSHMGWSGYFREYMFHSMLVQKGYVVIDMDYRASKGYGRDWRTAIYRHMGKPEVEDMRDGVNWLVDNANVDRERVGTYGGSYGGFLTLMSMFTAPDLFESGSAIRLVSDWAYYNHGYTSNILNTPADDAIAYERSSPIYFAEGLEKPLLINAPMVDDNVFFEDTVRLVQRLIELEKQDFETAIYPVEPHGFVQPSSWLNEYRRIFKLFETTL
ncbi:prolyl oligopeptidase family serine peptidase [Colwelliaceae bacterium 6471]